MSTTGNSTTPSSAPIARGPLIDWAIRRHGRIETHDGWQIAVRLPHEPVAGENALVDLSHRGTYEINGPGTGAALQALCGRDVPVRAIHQEAGWEAYRLTAQRAIVFGRSPGAGALDVTGGWATLALLGPNVCEILEKVTAVDVRDQTLPVRSCCQGPIFGVNTLFGHFSQHYELHVCSDSAEFFQEVLLDAGAEYRLQPAGFHYFQAARSDG